MFRTLKTTRFVYAPKSGSRVFAENIQAGGGLVVVTWSNGCRHVIGGVELVYHTSQPGAYWRPEARHVAGEMVRLYGGIAWDDRGDVHLIIPEGAALFVYETFADVTKVLGVPDDGRENFARLLLEGWCPRQDSPREFGHLPRLNLAAGRAFVKTHRRGYQVTEVTVTVEWHQDTGYMSHASVTDCRKGWEVSKVAGAAALEFVEAQSDCQDGVLLTDEELKQFVGFTPEGAPARAEG